MFWFYCQIVYINLVFSLPEFITLLLLCFRMDCRQHLLLLVMAIHVTMGSTLVYRSKREAGSQLLEGSASSIDHAQEHSTIESSPFHKTRNVQTIHLVPSTVSQQRPEETVSSEMTKKRSQGDNRKSIKRGKLSNKDLLHHLGMVKLKSPAINHHRKRLASQSRKTHGHKNGGDSKMFVIKLPPNPYYYAHHDLPPRPEVNSLPVDFNTNGKPSRVYHWNIPVLKKMVARKAGSSGKSAVFADSDVFNIDKQATWNDTDDDKSVYRKASFYAPKKQSKHPFRKYFAGNGKPHSFYVMDKSSYKKPVSVHRLLP